MIKVKRVERYVTVIAVIEVDPRIIGRRGPRVEETIEAAVLDGVEQAGDVKFLSIRNGVSAAAVRAGAEPEDWQ